MTITTLKNMTDNMRARLYKFNVFAPTNYYNYSAVAPRINTLANFACYATIDSNNKYVCYQLKKYLKTSSGYRPYKILIQDIPFARRRFRLLIDLSLPKALFGNNLSEIREYQLHEVIEAVYSLLLEFGIEISKEELLNTPHISRIDYCKNIYIQSNVEELVLLLKKCKKPRSRIYYCYPTSISIGTRKKRLNIYEKTSEVIAKANKKPASTTYKLARVLKASQKSYNTQVFRIEQRLYGRQTIARELKGIIAPRDITFKSLFSEKVASYVLNKHWTSLVNEEKFKTLLLGEQELDVITAEIIKLAGHKQKKKVPFFASYTKLLADKGEALANKDLRLKKSATSTKTYKKELYELLKQLPVNDPRLADYQAITNAIVNWDEFSVPIIPNDKN